MKRTWHSPLLLTSVLGGIALLLTGAQPAQPALTGGQNSPAGPTRMGSSARPEVVPGVVVIKIRSRAAAQSVSKPSATMGIPSLDATLVRVGARSVQKMFLHKAIPSGSGIPDISRIVRVDIPEGVNPISLARELEKDPGVEYAEPAYARRLAEVPNDPMFGQQHHLPQIHAPEAWDVGKGDSAVIITIIDTGVDHLHEDLAANVWRNGPEASGTAGIDDDGNGFVDDVHGWDFGNGTNGNPNTIPPDHPAWAHGTHVAGIACAVTGNGTGVAGVTWNCRYMPVKFGPANVDYTQGYAAIIYAADNGADIISNSWGGYGFLRWEQDVINYAHARGAIIVCAAGNDDADLPFYPASYQHAISVAAVDRYDRKASYSTYGPRVDICAPGGDLNGGILSTLPHSTYESGYWMGTSMATPMVSGVCGLVKSLHPDWTNDQIIRQVLLTADNIETLNPMHVGKMGHGRLNAYRALTDSVLQDPDARLACHSSSIDDSLLGNNNGVLERGETVHFKLNIQNCSIGAAQTAMVHLSSPSPNIQVLNGTISPVTFPADTVLQFMFTLTISGSAPAEEVDLVVTLQTGRGYFRVEREPVFIGMMPILLIDHDCAQPEWGVPHIELFFTDILDRKQIPYRYWDTGLNGFPSNILRVSPTVVLSSPWWGSSINQEERDALRTYLDDGGSLFFCSQYIGSYFHAVDASQEARSFMQDYLHAEYVADNSGVRQITGVENDPIGSGMSFGVWQPGSVPEITQSPEVIAPTAGADSIFSYTDGRTAAVKYRGDHKVVYLGFGLEAVDADQNTGIGDPSPIRTELFMRIINWLSFIEHAPLVHSGSIDSARIVLARIGPGVSDVQAMTLLWRVRGDSAFTPVAMAEGDSGNYVAAIPGPGRACEIEYFIQTTQPYYTWSSPVGAPDTVYRYQVGTTDVLATEVLPAEFHLFQNHPNPLNPTTTIRYTLPRGASVQLTVYNMLGQRVAVLVDERRDAGNHDVIFNASGLPSGVYLYRLRAGDFVRTKKMLILK